MVHDAEEYGDLSCQGKGADRMPSLRNHVSPARKKAMLRPEHRPCSSSRPDIGPEIRL
jgi:hypothetical protein